jgi:hypothetical protein
VIEVDGFDLLVQLGAAHGVLLPDPQWPEMLKALHPKQRAFVIDPSKRKCALAGRRGGKSFGIIYWLIEHWRAFPGETSLYIAQTLDHARGILWEDLKAVCRRWGFNVKTNEARLEVTFPNGYKVRLRGAENTKQAEKMRGPHYWRVVIDESHLFPDALLRHLINRVIDPALMDLNGELALCGTPGYDLIGLWYEATNDGRSSSDEDESIQWTTHHWTCLDNPYIRGGGAAYIERKKRDNHWTDDNPELIREYFGRWYHDPDMLVYPFDGEKNFYWDPDWEPGQGVKFVIGVDVGWHDGCGFTVAVKRADGPIIRIVESFSEVGLDDPKIAMVIKRLMRRYKTRNVYVDTKGGGKVTAETLKHYGIPAEAAIGGAKRPRIEYMRGLLIDGHLQLHPERAAHLAGELRTIPWKLDKDGKTKLDHKEGYIDECADAAINAVLMLSQTWALKRELPPVGTPERERLEEKRALAAAIKRGQKINPRAWGKRSKGSRMPTA